MRLKFEKNGAEQIVMVPENIEDNNFLQRARANKKLSAYELYLDDTFKWAKMRPVECEDRKSGKDGKKTDSLPAVFRMKTRRIFVSENVEEGMKATRSTWGQIPPCCSRNARAKKKREVVCACGKHIVATAPSTHPDTGEAVTDINIWETEEPFFVKQ